MSTTYTECDNCGVSIDEGEIYRRTSKHDGNDLLCEKCFTLELRECRATFQPDGTEHVEVYINGYYLCNAKISDMSNEVKYEIGIDLDYNSNQ